MKGKVMGAKKFTKRKQLWMVKSNNLCRAWQYMAISSAQWSLACKAKFCFKKYK